jgi:1-acyl-sn-glycerol-3-phosphate acyltransferase
MFIIKKYKMYLTIASQSLALAMCKTHDEAFNKLRVFFTKIIVKNSGTTINLIGQIDKDADIIIANHQSMLDIFVLEEIIGNDVRFIGRKGIMDKWPVSKIVDMVGHITVDQSDKRAIIKLLKDVKACQGKKVIIFPEGTRSRSRQIEKFEIGSKILVEKLNLKAQPVVITNILDVYDESKKTATTGIVDIVVLPLVPTDEEDWYENMHQEMKATYNAQVS